MSCRWFLCIYRMAFSSFVQMLPLYLPFCGWKCVLGTLCHWFLPLAWPWLLLSELVGNFPSPFGDWSRRPWGLHVETVFAIAALCLHVWDLHQVSILYKLLPRYSACGVDCGAHGHMSCIKMKAAWCGPNEHTNYHTSWGPEFLKTLNCRGVRHLWSTWILHKIVDKHCYRTLAFFGARVPIYLFMPRGFLCFCFPDILGPLAWGPRFPGAVPR